MLEVEKLLLLNMMVNILMNFHFFTEIIFIFLKLMVLGETNPWRIYWDRYDPHNIRIAPLGE